eukprot:6101982-Pleurochrysis_carterae.AAC.3
MHYACDLARAHAPACARARARPAHEPAKVPANLSPCTRRPARLRCARAPTPAPAPQRLRPRPTRVRGRFAPSPCTCCPLLSLSTRQRLRVPLDGLLPSAEAELVCQQNARASHLPWQKAPLLRRSRHNASPRVLQQPKRACIHRGCASHAQVHGCRTIFFCRNNGYAISTKVRASDVASTRPPHCLQRPASVTRSCWRSAPTHFLTRARTLAPFPHNRGLPRTPRSCLYLRSNSDLSQRTRCFCPAFSSLRSRFHARFADLLERQVTDQYVSDGVAPRGLAFGMPVIRVDGNDILAVCADSRMDPAPASRPSAFQSPSLSLLVSTSSFPPFSGRLTSPGHALRAVSSLVLWSSNAH